MADQRVRVRIRTTLMHRPTNNNAVSMIELNITQTSFTTLYLEKTALLFGNAGALNLL